MRAQRTVSLTPTTHAPWWLAGLVAVLCWVLPAQAQQGQFPAARLTSLTPPGGKAGTTFEVTLNGGDLDDITDIWFSHPGIKAERVPDTPRFRVTVAPTTPVGLYDVRAVTRWGISNPRVLAVGSLAEALEQEPNNDLPQAQKVALNTTVNGVVSASTDADYYAFEGKKGQRVLIHCAASSIDSRLNPLVQLFDAERELGASRNYAERDALVDRVLPADGTYHVRVCEFAYLTANQDYFYRLSITTAPWIDTVYPPVVEPGKPTTVTLYGRNLPGGKPEPAGQTSGRPLDRLAVQVNPPADALAAQRLDFAGFVPARSFSLDGFEHRVQNDAGVSSPVLIGLARAPVVLDNEANNAQDAAQEIPVPCELCGRIEKRRDRDWYAFTAKKDEVYTLEAYCDRLGSPAELVFELRRADGQVLGEFGENNDPPTVGGRFFVRTDDPRTRFVVPADGRYLLQVRSHIGDSQASPRHVYRLSILPEQPDFRLVLVGNNDNAAGGCTVRQGGNQDFLVVCHRLGNFNGEVALSVDGLPKGVTCVPQGVGPNLRQTSLVFSAATDAAPWAGRITVRGTATIDGKEVVREARAGCIVWPTAQPNVPAVSRMCYALALAVREPGPFTLNASVKELTVPVGSTVTVPLEVKRNWPDVKGNVQIVRLAGPAQANGQLLNIPNATVGGGAGNTQVRFQVPENIPTGTYNLVFQASSQFPYNKDPKAKQKPNTTYTDVSPAIRLTLVPKGTVVKNGAVNFKDQPLLAASADDWRYLAQAKVKGDTWRQPSFDDGKWTRGKAPLGYGEEEISKRRGTTVADQGQNVLFRRSFDLPGDLLSQKGVVFRLHVASDNSAEVYINGEPADLDPEADHEFSYWNRDLDVPAKLLKSGKNVIAVRVKNTDGSSDLFFDLELIAQVPNPPQK
jgi:hypothetical protein